MPVLFVDYKLLFVDSHLYQQFLYNKLAPGYQTYPSLAGGSEE